MAASLPKDAIDPVIELIRELESNRWRSDELLRRAAEHADRIAPAVIATVEKAANGAYLLPTEANLLFWGIHILGAARCAGICRPLLTLLRRNREESLDRVLGDAATETVPGILISTFDGDADSLIEAIADRNVDSFVRWALFDTLARLTFDGHVPREKTWALLDHFERESLAEPGDPAWQGWVDTITHLGMRDLYDSVRRVWDDGRIPPDEADRDFVERRFAQACALEPGDPTMFNSYGRQPLTNAVHALSWTMIEKDRERNRRDKRLERDDPAIGIALKDEELDWLEGFLCSDKVAASTMTLEQVDGLFYAIACGPSVSKTDYMPVIWDTSDDLDPKEPAFDSEAQAEYVVGLLQRHLTTIARRLDRGHRSDVIVETDDDELTARRWAGGFINGVGLRAEEWGAHENDFIKQFLDGIVALGADEGYLRQKGIDVGLRDKLVEALPTNLLRLYHLWRGRDDPFPPPVDNRYQGRKVGRNEPCPCGSGKKFKFCCGSPTKGSLR